MQVLHRGLETDSLLHGQLHSARIPYQRHLSVRLHDAQRVRGEDHPRHLRYAQHVG